MAVKNFKNGKLVSTTERIKSGNDVIISTTTNQQDLIKEKRRERAQHFSSGATLGTGLFSIVLLILMCAVFYRFAFKGENMIMPTIDGLLDMFSNVRIISNDFLFGISDVLKITADWGLFNGFRDFINVLGGVFSLVVWIVSGLFNVLSFAIAIMFILLLRVLINN